MATSVRLSDDFVCEAKAHADAERRSLPKQIEYWATIGRMMIDNPDLSFEFVSESLLATEEAKNGLVKPYVRRTKNNGRV